MIIFKIFLILLITFYATLMMIIFFTIELFIMVHLVIVS